MQVNYCSSRYVREYDAGAVTGTSLPSELTLSQLLRLLYEQYLSPCGDTCLRLLLKQSSSAASMTSEAG